MSKVYKCDSCEKMIEDPYAVKMKEFYIAAECDMCGVFPVNAKRIKKIHLCHDCYKGLCKIANEEAERSDQNAR